MAECSKQFGRFASFDPTTFGRASQLAEQDPSTTASLAAVFLAQYTEDNERRVLRSNDFETAPPP